MSANFMGPLGVTVAVLGLALYYPAQSRLAAALDELPVILRDLAHARLRGLVGAIVIVVLAVVVFLVAREWDHAREGLLVCAAMLLLNAVGVAVLRIRWLGELAPPVDIARRYIDASLLQMVGSWLLFIGCTVYLLRP